MSCILVVKYNSDRTRVVNLKFCTLKLILPVTYNQYWFYVRLPLKNLYAIDPVKAIQRPSRSSSHPFYTPFIPQKV
jgi:hypothetical protein